MEKNFLIDKLSVFFPAYNEEKNIEKTVRDAIKILEKIAKKWEVIIVDDGSSDQTGAISDQLDTEFSQVKAVHHRPNRGYGGALKSGFEKSKYDWVAFADSDGQFDFSEIKKFINRQKETNSDLVLGIRTKRADPMIRKLFTFVWSKLLPRIILGLRVTDYSCGFKLIRRKVYKSVEPLEGEEKVTQLELLTKAQRQGFKFAEIGVTHLPRKYGSQTGADLKVVIKSIRDLFKLWKLLK